MLFDKIASDILGEKIYLYFNIGDGQPRELALCQLYRHTFVPYWRATTHQFTDFSSMQLIRPIG